MRKHTRVNRAMRAKQRTLKSALANPCVEAPLAFLVCGARVAVTSSHPVWPGKKGIVRSIGKRSHPLDECTVIVAIKGYDRELCIRVSSTFLAPQMSAKDERDVVIYDQYDISAKRGLDHQNVRQPAELPGGNVITKPPVYGQVEPPRRPRTPWRAITHIVASQREHALWLGVTHEVSK